MSRILITGGTGFIGSRLAMRCVHSGDVVRVLAQTNTPAERRNAAELQAVGVDLIIGSITDPTAVSDACSGIRTVYHLAAAQHEANVPDSYYHEVNVQGTRNLLAAAAGARVARFVHGSTIGVYRSGNRTAMTDEAPLEPDNIYGATKLEGENVVRAYADTLNTTIVRISETYGPGDGRLLKLFRAASIGRLFRIGDGRNLHHPVYIDDLVDGLRLAAIDQRTRGATFVLAGPSPVTTDQMVDAISYAVGRTPPRVRVPLWPLTLAATVLEASFRPLGVQPPLHRRRMNFFVKNYQFSGDAARAFIGYQPFVDFPQGAALAAAWYRSQNLLPPERQEARHTTAGAAEGETRHHLMR